jgi:hypothetical protein
MILIQLSLPTTLSISGIMESSEALSEVADPSLPTEILTMRQSTILLVLTQDISLLSSTHLSFCKYSTLSTAENSMKR